MQSQALLAKMKGFFDVMTGRNRFDRFEYAILKTMLMLAAVDGEVSEGEFVRFRDMAAKFREYGGKAFDDLWDASLRSAGYLLLQSRLLEQDALVAAFVREAETEFVGEVVLESTEGCERAFEFLTGMAAADGDYSDVERKCLSALSQRVKAAREQAVLERYPRAKVC